MEKLGINTKATHHKNEVSEDLKQYFEKIDTQFQLTPSHMHQRNYSEWVVITFKNNFIETLCTLEPHPPFYLWYCLLPKVTTTVNMLRQYRLNSGISAYEQVDGVHKFYCALLSPLERKVKINENHISDASTIPTQ